MEERARGGREIIRTIINNDDDSAIFKDVSNLV